MKLSLKLVLPLAVIFIMAIAGAFRTVPLWACLFVGAGIQSLLGALVEILEELRR